MDGEEPRGRRGARAASVVHMTLKTEPRGGSPIECFDVKIDNCKIL